MTSRKIFRHEDDDKILAHGPFQSGEILTRHQVTFGKQ